MLLGRLVRILHLDNNTSNVGNDVHAIDTAHCACMQATCRIEHGALLLSRLLFVGHFAASTILTSSLALRCTPFPWAFSIILASQCLSAAVPILADTVISAATSNPHQYGQCRLWGAVWWGGVSLISGLVVEIFGFKTAFVIYLCSAMPGAHCCSMMMITHLAPVLPDWCNSLATL